MSKNTGTNNKTDGGSGFSTLLRNLVQVPKDELLAEERKYEAAKKRRKAKAKRSR